MHPAQVLGEQIGERIGERIGEQILLLYAGPSGLHLRDCMSGEVLSYVMPACCSKPLEWKMWLHQSHNRAPAALGSKEDATRETMPVQALPAFPALWSGGSVAALHGPAQAPGIPFASLLDPIISCLGERMYMLFHVSRWRRVFGWQGQKVLLNFAFS